MERDQSALEEIQRQSERDDTVIVHMVYRGKWVSFDMPYMQVRFMGIDELVRKYVGPAFQAINVRPEDGETHQAVSSSAETTV